MVWTVRDELSGGPHPPTRFRAAARGTVRARTRSTMNKKSKSHKLNQLSLRRETLRALTHQELTSVGGGDGYFSKLSDCIFNTCVSH
jgi:hypothetical protein